MILVMILLPGLKPPHARVCISTASALICTQARTCACASAIDRLFVSMRYILDAALAVIVPRPALTGGGATLAFHPICDAGDR